MTLGEVKPRRWWIAVPLALINPVVAYLYLGRPKRALAALIVTAGFTVPFFELLRGRITEPLIGLAFFGAVVLFLLIVFCDSLVIALKSKSYQLSKWNRWWIYISVFSAFAIGTRWLEFSALGGRSQGPAFSVETNSMAPTLLQNERFLTYPFYYDDHEPERGDVVVFHTQGHSAMANIKRIIGLPGDVIELKNGNLYLNGSAISVSDRGSYSFNRSNKIEKLTLAEETLPKGRRIFILRSNPGSILNDMASTRVPNDCYFVLGDNRGNSMDSRLPDFGFIPRSNLLGRVGWVYWSPKFDRIGKAVL